MKVSVLLFARLRREAGIENVVVELPEDASVRDAARLVEQMHPVVLAGCMAAVNERYATPDTRLTDGDELAFLPPVAGGSDDADVHCELTSEPLSLPHAEAFLVRPAWGAQAYFVGTVRSPNKGMEIDHLQYEAYLPMARRVMQDAAAQARTRYDVGGVYIAHRTGELRPAETSILIGVGSAHRRAALEACDFLIEHLKVHLPVWKLEVGQDGASWVEGSTGAPTL